MRSGTGLFLSIAFLAPAASAQEGWQEYQDPYGTFTVSHPANWKVQQNRPGEVEVTESPHTWVRVAMLATSRGEGATAWEEYASFRKSLPKGLQSGTLSQLSLRPDRLLWSYDVSGTEDLTLHGLLAVEVNGILHYGVAYQAPLEKWEKTSKELKQIASSLRFGQFRIPEWMVGGDRGLLPDPERPPFERCWSEVGDKSAYLPTGWQVRKRGPGQEVFRRDGAARVAWYVSELSGEKAPPERLVAEVVGVDSITADGSPDPKTTEARLFPVPKKSQEGKSQEEQKDEDENYVSFNNMSFTFRERGGVLKRGFALVALFWSKKKPDPYTAEVIVFWTDEDKFRKEAALMEQMAAWMQSWESWEGNYCRHNLRFLENKLGNE